MLRYHQGCSYLWEVYLSKTTLSSNQNRLQLVRQRAKKPGKSQQVTRGVGPLVFSSCSSIPPCSVSSPSSSTLPHLHPLKRAVNNQRPHWGSLSALLNGLRTAQKQACGSLTSAPWHPHDITQHSTALPLPHVRVIQYSVEKSRAVVQLFILHSYTEVQIVLGVYISTCNYT